MFLVGQPEQVRSPRHLSRQVKPPPHGLPDQPRQLLLTGHVDGLQRRPLPEPSRTLHRHPVSLRKHRPQRLVPPRHIRQRRPQRPRIKITLKPQRQRNRIHRAALAQPAQEPQPLLSEKQRHPARIRRRAGLIGGRTSPDAASTARAIPTGDGASNNARTPSSAPSTARTRDTSRIASRPVTAQLKETVIHPHPAHAQHLSEQPAQHLLPTGPRGPPAPAPPPPATAAPPYPASRSQSAAAPRPPPPPTAP